MKHVARIALLALSACSAPDPAANTSETRNIQAEAAPPKAALIENDTAQAEQIGGASMDKDGTITIQLRTENDKGIWEATYTHRKSDKDYQKILAEIGSLKPGEGKALYAPPGGRDAR